MDAFCGLVAPRHEEGAVNSFLSGSNQNVIQEISVVAPMCKLQLHSAKRWSVVSNPEYHALFSGYVSHPPVANRCTQRGVTTALRVAGDLTPPTRGGQRLHCQGRWLFFAQAG